MAPLNPIVPRCHVFPKVGLIWSAAAVAAAPSLICVSVI